MRCLAAIPRLGGTGAAAPDSGRGPRAAPLDGVQQAVHLARGQVLAFILRLSPVRRFGSLRIQGLVTVRPVNRGQKNTFCPLNSRERKTDEEGEDGECIEGLVAKRCNMLYLYITCLYTW